MSGGTGSLELQIWMARSVFQRVLPPWNRVAIVLCTRVPAINANPNQLVEVVGGGYGRVYANLNQMNWSVATDGTVYLNQTLLFPVATADWGYVPGWAMLSAHTGTAPWAAATLASGRLLQPKKIKAGQRFRIAPRKLCFDFVDAA